MTTSNETTFTRPRGPTGLPELGPPPAPPITGRPAVPRTDSVAAVRAYPVEPLPDECFDFVASW